MTENIKNALDELKALVMTLHRSAGHLDDLIQQIENDGSITESDDYFRMIVCQIIRYRVGMLQDKNWLNLDEREQSLWNSLLDEIDYKEES